MDHTYKYTTPNHKTLKENIRECLHDLEIDQEFLDMTPNA